MNRLFHVLGWPLAAVLSAAAVHVCRGAVGVATPVDASLWLVALVIAFVAWSTRPTLLVAVPVLLAAMIALPEERARLFAYGAVVAIVFFVALADRRDSRVHDAGAGGAPSSIAIAAVVLLRWIPLANVLWFRELLLLALVAAIVFVLRSTPLAIAIGVLVALFTPAVPLRTLAWPALALLAAMAVRWFGVRRRPGLRVFPA
ncbi:MAG TPA: hypothetical protein VF698_14545, partial [Thermoanaerobaculia bacterium]